MNFGAHCWAEYDSDFYFSQLKKNQHFSLRSVDVVPLQTVCCRCDKDIKVSYTVYNRLSVLLKSLLAITRVTPAYKLSRKQGHDYVILYRCVEQVDLNHLEASLISLCSL